MPFPTLREKPCGVDIGHSETVVSLLFLCRPELRRLANSELYNTRG